MRCRTPSMRRPTSSRRGCRRPEPLHDALQEALLAFHHRLAQQKLEPLAEGDVVGRHPVGVAPVGVVDPLHAARHLDGKPLFGQPLHNVLPRQVVVAHEDLPGEQNDGRLSEPAPQGDSREFPDGPLQRLPQLCRLAAPLEDPQHRDHSCQNTSIARGL